MRVLACVCVGYMWKTEKMCDRIRRNGCHCQYWTPNSASTVTCTCVRVCVCMFLYSMTDIRTRIYTMENSIERNHFWASFNEPFANGGIQFRIESFAIWFSFYICDLRIYFGFQTIGKSTFQNLWTSSNDFVAYFQTGSRTISNDTGMCGFICKSDEGSEQSKTKKYAKSTEIYFYWEKKTWKEMGDLRCN